MSSQFSFWKTFSFVFCDVVSVGVIPFLGCLVGGVMASGFGLDTTMEVLFIVGCIALFSTVLVLILHKIFNTTYFTEVQSRRAVILKWLSAINLLWLILSVRNLVKIASKKDGVRLGATPFGFFLASLLLACSKFAVYAMLYAVKIAPNGKTVSCPAKPIRSPGKINYSLPPSMEPYQRRMKDSPQQWSLGQIQCIAVQ